MSTRWVHIQGTENLRTWNKTGFRDDFSCFNRYYHNSSLEPQSQQESVSNLNNHFNWRGKAPLINSTYLKLVIEQLSIQPEIDPQCSCWKGFDISLVIQPLSFFNFLSIVSCTLKSQVVMSPAGSNARQRTCRVKEFYKSPTRFSDDAHVLNISSEN